MIGKPMSPTPPLPLSPSSSYDHQLINGGPPECNSVVRDLRAAGVNGTALLPDTWSPALPRNVPYDSFMTQVYTQLIGL